MPINKFVKFRKSGQRLSGAAYASTVSVAFIAAILLLTIIWIVLRR